MVPSSQRGPHAYRCYHADTHTQDKYLGHSQLPAGLCKEQFSPSKRGLLLPLERRLLLAESPSEQLLRLQEGLP